MPAEASRCDTCGATRGEHHKCPFCGIVAAPQQHPQLRFVCPACGAPRIPVPTNVEPSKAMTDALADVRSARSSRAVWRVAGGLTGAFGVLALLLFAGVLAIASPALVPALAGGLITAIPFIFAALALINAGRRDQQVKSSLDAAWIEAARSLAETKGTITPRQLRESFGLEESDARQLAARLGAHHEVTTDVTDEGELALSVAPRVRVADSPMRVAEPNEEAAEEVEEEAEGVRMADKVEQ